MFKTYNNFIDAMRIHSNRIEIIWLQVEILLDDQNLILVIFRKTSYWLYSNVLKWNTGFRNFNTYLNYDVYNDII